MAGITIQGRHIAPDEAVYIIAEMSANHHGRYERAERIGACGAGGRC